MESFSLGGNRASNRPRVGHGVDTPRRCTSITVGAVGFAHGEMIFVDIQQGPRGTDLLFPVGLVVKNHVSRRAPKVGADGSQSHVGRAELKREGQHVSFEVCSSEAYNLLAIQLKVLLGWHLAGHGLIGVRWINTLGHVCKDLLGAEHTICIEPRAIVGTICRARASSCAWSITRRYH